MVFRERDGASSGRTDTRMGDTAVRRVRRQRQGRFRADFAATPRSQKPTGEDGRRLETVRLQLEESLPSRTVGRARFSNFRKMSATHLRILASLTRFCPFKLQTTFAGTHCFFVS